MDYSWMNADPNSMSLGNDPTGHPGAYSYGYGYGYGYPMPIGTGQRGTFPQKGRGGMFKKQWPKKKKVGPPAEQMTCAVCQVTCTGEQPWLKHLEGKKHKLNEAKALRNGGVPPPKPVNTTITVQADHPSAQMTKVVGGPKALQGVSFVKAGESTPSLLTMPAPPETTAESGQAEGEGQENTGEVPPPAGNIGEPVPAPEVGKSALKCELCGVVVNGPQPWATHAAGNKHKRKVEEALNPGKIRAGGGRGRGNFRGFRGTGPPNRGGRGRGRGGVPYVPPHAGMPYPMPPMPGGPQFFNYGTQ